MTDVITRANTSPNDLIKNGLSLSSLFGKAEPEWVAGDILDFALGKNLFEWVKIPKSALKKVRRSAASEESIDWVELFVFAGFLKKNWFSYEVTDLFVRSLALHSGKNSLENFENSFNRPEEIQSAMSSLFDEYERLYKLQFAHSETEKA